MVSKLTSSEKALLQLLLASTTYRPMTVLAKQIGYSKRSAYYFMNSLSKKLLKLHITPPRNVRGQGYYLTSKSKIAVRKLLQQDQAKFIYHQKLPANRRLNLILLALFANSPHVTIKNLTKITHVTRNSTVNDLNKLKTILARKHILLRADHNGHRLEGDELTIRNYIQDRFAEMAKEFDWLAAQANPIALIDVKEIQSINLVVNDWLHFVERKQSRSFTDDAIRKLELFYAFILRRILADHVLRVNSFPQPLSNRHELLNQPEFSLASNFLVQFGIAVADSEVEIFYLESLLLSGQLNAVDTKNQTTIKENVMAATKQVITNFKKLAGIHFHNEDQLADELYVHLISTYYRVKYNRQYHEGMADSIKANYFNIYIYTKMAIRPFVQLNQQPLNESEISLIAIYFGSQIYYENTQTPRALLVCSTGIGTSRLLKSQLEANFPDLQLIGPITKRDYNLQTKVNADVVLSTIPLKRHNQDVIVVHPILNHQELDALRKRLVVQGVIRSHVSTDRLSALLDVISDNTKIINQSALINGIKEVLTFSAKSSVNHKKRYQPLLSELINKKTIQFASANAVDWQHAIALAAKPLQEEGKINQNYINAMIANVKQNGPYINIGDKVAFAHARPEKGVKQLGMSFLRLDQAIDLINPQHPIQLIFVLAAVDDHSHLRALSELATMLGDQQRLNALLAATTAQQVEAIILEGEK